MKIPPLLLVLLLGALMYVISLFTPSVVVHPVLRFTAAAVIFITGSGISLSGVLAFRRSKTSVNPLSPDKASSLVETGIYRISRNPMYVGFLMMLLAWSIALANLYTLPACVVFFWYINRFQIPEEERALKAMFQQSYTAYTRRVRRWL
ncbi:uncharacterized protein HMF8227_00198 [Saliniradius amylolyticus]|uniref:Protein-S-isoprenylcysteine O-methyltransferase n=1 Tax=Saliniradius amylolyticus TaxID=2183582 RepID=A0A2S2DZ99_9ALTE|nr:isoprenylcysteine carboxylmethyltransferase family protein [Saliniradius amylolyticus]AWL10706.1 uncharacterized protein HMF8227_00198 [Saliniradius amylolyticus]